MEAAKLEAYQNLVTITQEMVDKQKSKPDSEDSLDGIPSVEEDWPGHLWERVREINDGSLTLKLDPIEEVWLDNLPSNVDMDIQSMNGD
ncbi:hypothetical protein DD594_25495 [Enterobacter cloacae complex sp. 4DZ1-17B1]|nr:hypothetical protein DD594_25495 [Enterobacter cloacae complex sp. 4DZ1-17B1]